MIHSAVVRLTLWYLAIIMALSLSFSLVLYQLSSQEINQDLRRQGTVLRQIYPPFLNFERLRQDQYDTAQRHLAGRLILLNLVCLGLAGASSYLLARRTLQPIEQALEAQSRFTADAAHELRTPLTAMQTEIEVALRGGHLGKAEAITLLKSNLEEVGKLSQLADGLLRLAQRNGRPAPFGPVPLAEVVTEATTRLAAAAKQKQIVFDLDAVKPLTVRGDRQSLIDLMALLLDNAIKYSPHGTKVSLSERVIGHQAVITVTDQGRGIAAVDLPHIFDRFYRADTSRSKDAPGGYGLGLSIAEQIVQRHGGEIGVSSLPGRGSTFTIQLPMVRIPS